MAFFIKKKKELESQSNTCDHKFQDFPWFLETETKVQYNKQENYLSYKIIEPYVCIYCGTRKNVQLESGTLKGYSLDEMNKKIQQIQQQYADKIKPRAIVEDMINDLKLVDVNYLKYYHLLQGTKDPSTSRSIKNDKILTL